MPSEHSSQSVVEWRVLWSTGQITVGFTAREQAEQLLARKSRLSGEIQSRCVTPWESDTSDEESR